MPDDFKFDMDYQNHILTQFRDNPPVDELLIIYLKEGDVIGPHHYRVDDIASDKGKTV